MVFWFWSWSVARRIQHSALNLIFQTFLNGWELNLMYSFRKFSFDFPMKWWWLPQPKETLCWWCSCMEVDMEPKETLHMTHYHNLNFFCWPIEPKGDGPSLKKLLWSDNHRSVIGSLPVYFWSKWTSCFTHLTGKALVNGPVQMWLLQALRQWPMEDWPYQQIVLYKTCGVDGAYYLEKKGKRTRQVWSCWRELAVRLVITSYDHLAQAVYDM